VAGLGTSGLAGAEPVVSTLEGGAGLVARIKAAIEPLTEMLATTWPLLLGAGAIIVVVFAIRAGRAELEAFRTGAKAR
jgi:cell division protein FtsX